MGKTRIVQKFLREHRSSFDDVTGRTRLPIVAVQMPPAPSERDLYEELLVSMGVFYQRTKASRPYGNALGSRRDSSKCACSLSMRSIPFWLARSANSGSF
jgi:Bacterial TniB protein